MNEPETLIKMAKRHVREGASRVTEQEAVVVRMNRTQRFNQEATALELLHLYHSILQQSEDHLSRLLNEERLRGPTH